ncbi:hypothetical protein PybrP1_004270 [[Pythium] brassicae (nom. inval.)]|nr:hypothetical protein PybrP1_004270 [[Pythium] brassicae (nom. inval.)]
MRASTLALAVLTLAAYADSAAGATTTVLTRYADSGCATTPQQVALSVASTAASCSATSVSGCASAGTSANSYYAKQTCAPVVASTDSAVATAKAYFTASSSPYVLMEAYATGASCSSDALVSAVAFLADTKCLVVDSGDSSMKVSVAADGSAILTTFSGASCSGTPTKASAIASGDTAGKTCVNGALKFYTSTEATPVVSTGTSTSAAPAPVAAHAMTAVAVALLAATMIV